MPLTLPKPDALKIETFKLTGLQVTDLSVLTPKKLSDLEITAQLGARPGAVIKNLVLSPVKPRSDQSYLTFHAPLMVEANPLPSNNIALFSSAFPAASDPAVQLEFMPVKAGKKQLVEFNITLNEPAKVYKFRVSQFPLGTVQDISISGSQVISVIIAALPDYPYTYGASIRQLNTRAEACGWIFHSVKVSSVD